MLVNEYREEQTISVHTLTKCNDVTFTQDRDLTTRAIEMLEMWGVFNRYRSGCGYKALSIYRMLNPSNAKSEIIIENDVDFIDAALKSLKNSKIKKNNELYEIANLYYKGLDCCVDGFEWNQKLTTREVAEYLDVSQSTIRNRIREIESYIVAELSKSDINSYF